VTLPSDINKPTSPADPLEARRWEESRRRRRMLYGQWEQDLAERIQTDVGAQRADAWGRPSRSSNVLKSVCTQLAILHDEAPTIGHADADAAARMTKLLTAAQWSPLMQTVGRDLVGLREILVRVDVRTPDSAEPFVCLYPVFPDLVTARPADDRPDRPVAVERAWLCQDGKWATEVVDPSGSSPVCRIERDGRDITVDELGDTFSGEAYPYRDGAGAPVLPYVLYHAQTSGTLWNPYELVELVEGTLEVAKLYTHVNHVMQDASWPQRWIAGGRITGATITEGEGQAQRRVVVMDATAVAEIEADENTQGGVQVGQWQPGGDPKVMLEVADAVFARVATEAGISPSDFKRVGGDARSGYALEISDAGKRAAAKKLRPTMEAGDLATITLVAKLWNGRKLSPPFPEDGWTIAYPALKPSAAELKARLETVREMTALGVVDRVEQYAMLRDVDMETARVRLAEIDRARALAAEAEGAAADILSGIVMREVRETSKDVAAGLLSREAGAALIAEGLKLPPERALRLLGPVGFKPATQAATTPAPTGREDETEDT
jgi:hypothetical protein